MKVGLKLFSKDWSVVLEKDVIPKEAGEANVLVHKGIHYGYQGLYNPGVVVQGEPAQNPYARFVECAPPLSIE